MRMVRLSAIALIAAGWPSIALSANEVGNYREAERRCAVANITHYDDGVTPANVVAKVLSRICRAENRELYSLAISGHPSAYAKGIDGAEIDFLTGIVLFHRANKSATPK
jgi:hypothetical protein